MNKHDTKFIMDNVKELIIAVVVILAFIYFTGGKMGRIWESVVDSLPSLIKLSSSLLSGIVIGISSELYLLKYKHDSILRYAYFEEANKHHHKTRSNFCAIVNDRLPLLSESGESIGPLKVKFEFYSSVGTLLLIFWLGLMFLNFNTASSYFSIVWSFSLIITCLIIYFVLRRAIRSNIHRTMVSIDSSGDDSKVSRWILISGERAEDGVPTKNLTMTERTGDVGFFRRLFLIPK